MAAVKGPVPLGDFGPRDRWGEERGYFRARGGDRRKLDNTGTGVFADCGVCGDSFDIIEYDVR